MIAATLAIELFLMTCIGIFAAKAKIVTGNFTSQLTNFLMKIALPCLIVVSINSNPFSMETLKNCFVALVLGVVVVLLSLAIGQIIYMLMKKTGAARIMRYGLAFTHFSFMGIPIIDALFGAQGNLYYVMFLVPVRILYYSLSPKLFGAAGRTEEKKNFGQIMKGIFNPCLCAVIVGCVFWICGWQFPAVIQYCLSSLNKVCSPLGLILCGMTLGKYDLKKLLNFRYFRMPILRTIAMPIIFLLLTRLLVQIGVDSVLCNMIVIYCALPCASMTAVYAIQYESDPEIQFEAAGSVFFATLLSTLTLPVWHTLLHTFSV